MTLRLEHNGRELTFNEHDESWSCMEMEMRASSLKALKAKIDRFDSQARKIAVPVVYVGHNLTVEKATIVTLCGPKDWGIDYNIKPTNFSGNRERSIPAVWITIMEGNKLKRTKKSLPDCIAPTPENMEQINSALTLRRDAKALQERANEIIKAIPRLTIEDLREKDVEQEGEEA